MNHEYLKGIRKKEKVKLTLKLLVFAHEKPADEHRVVYPFRGAGCVITVTVSIASWGRSDSKLWRECRRSSPFEIIDDCELAACWPDRAGER